MIYGIALTLLQVSFYQKEHQTFTSKLLWRCLCFDPLGPFHMLLGFIIEDRVVNSKGFVFLIVLLLVCNDCLLDLP